MELSCRVALLAMVSLLAGSVNQCRSQALPSVENPEKIIIDTDIGDYIDDAFAVALALSSPELRILGLSATAGDTATRAKMLDRIVGETGHAEIPVAQGASFNVDNFTQRAYAEGGQFARAHHAGSVDFILEQIKKNPGQITLVAIGPLFNVGGLIDKDPMTFKQLKRVVIMGGAFEPFTDIYGVSKPHKPVPEWNIKNDVASAQKLFNSGVPVMVLPVDSTENLKLDEIARSIIFARGSALTDALTLIYQQWSLYGNQTPTLYDVMTIAWMLNPSLCPMKPMHVSVDSNGATRETSGIPNAEVCLHSDPERFLQFIVPRLAR